MSAISSVGGLSSAGQAAPPVKTQPAKPAAPAPPPAAASSDPDGDGDNDGGGLDVSA